MADSEVSHAELRMWFGLANKSTLVKVRYVLNVNKHVVSRTSTHCLLVCIKPRPSFPNLKVPPVSKHEHKKV